MVGLISQSSIEGVYKIDSVERAIIFAALALQLAIGNTSDNEDLLDLFSLKVSPSGTSELNLKIDAFLPINSYNYARYGGNIYRSLIEYPTDSLNVEQSLSISVNPSTAQTPTMIDFPYNIFQGNFETYLYFYSSILFASIDNNRNRIITIKPQIDSFGEYVRIKIELPLNVEKWALGNNYVESVERVVTTTYKTWDTNTLNFGTTSTLNNNTILNNDTILTN